MRAGFWVAAAALVVVAVGSAGAMRGWRFGESTVQVVAAAWWLALAVAGVVVFRALAGGTWVGRRGVRIEWLFHREILPWRAIRAFWVVPAPVSFGGRIERLVIEMDDGTRVTVRGTDSYLHTIFGADRPDTLRHTLERERRFYGGADLPRRRPRRPLPAPSEPILDLRDRPPETVPDSTAQPSAPVT